MVYFTMKSDVTVTVSENGNQIIHVDEFSVEPPDKPEYSKIQDIQSIVFLSLD